MNESIVSIPLSEYKKMEDKINELKDDINKYCKEDDIHSFRSEIKQLKDDISNKKNELKDSQLQVDLVYKTYKIYRFGFILFFFILSAVGILNLFSFDVSFIVIVSIWTAFLWGIEKLEGR